MVRLWYRCLQGVLPTAFKKMKRVRLIIAGRRAAKDVKQAAEACGQGGMGHASFGSLALVMPR
jgi:hypothetical protein